MGYSHSTLEACKKKKKEEEPPLSARLRGGDGVGDIFFPHLFACCKTALLLPEETDPR